MTLELGGNAAVIVHRDADVAYAAERIAFGGFTYAGQSCISAQRIYVHDDIYDAFAAISRPRRGAENRRSARRGHRRRAGDRWRAADRIGEWIDEATAAGARYSPAARAREGIGGRR